VLGKGEASNFKFTLLIDERGLDLCVDTVVFFSDGMPPAHARLTLARVNQSKAMVMASVREVPFIDVGL